MWEYLESSRLQASKAPVNLCFKTSYLLKIPYTHYKVMLISYTKYDLLVHTTKKIHFYFQQCDDDL